MGFFITKRGQPPLRDVSIRQMLSQQLREMESDGIISRKVYPVVPHKTEYALTGLGKATVPIVHAMDKWGADFFTRLGVPIPCDEEE